MDKEYIEKQYTQIIAEWRCARDEDERWQLRQRMVELERTAGTLFGCDYMDDIHKRYISKIK